MPERTSSRARMAWIVGAAIAATLAWPNMTALAQDDGPEARIAATVARFDEAMQAFDFDALRRLLAPEFTESTRGCGPDNPRNSRKAYLSTLSGVARTRPSFRRERGPLDIQLLGGGQYGVARSRVSDRVEWPSGTLTSTFTEAIFLIRLDSGYKLTSLDARLACTDMKLVGSMPPPPGA